MTQLTFKGIEVVQGNRNGKTLLTESDEGKVLTTTDMSPCVAVCGYNGSMAFMIHSDSTGTGGKGAVDLITGLQELVEGIGGGGGYTITLHGGSVPGVKAYLSENLPEAEIVEGEASDGAYITHNGVVAHVKRVLAEKLGVDSVSVESE